MSPIDIIIVSGYLLTVVGVGVYAGRRDRTSDEFFVAGRQVPWWAVLGSLVATEVSAATFLAVPGVGFSENMNYLQMGIGSILARFFVAGVFVAAFYRAGCVSIYEFLGQRFGPLSQKTGSFLFLLTRLLASGVRLMIAASGLSIILGIPLEWSIPGFVLLALIYTGAGGIRAVIWTDCIQAIVFISAGFAVLTYLLNTVGWEAFSSIASEAGRFEILRFTPVEEGFAAWFSDANVLWLALGFGFIQTTAALGTDQDLTQRLLAARSAQQAQRSLILSGFIAMPIAALFLMVGIGLFAYAQTAEVQALLALEGGNDAFPTFISELAPAGLRGLLLAGVLAAAMSSLDSAMAALSSSAIKDFIEPFRKEGPNAAPIRLSKAMTLVFALFLGLIAWLLGETGEEFLWLAFQVSSVTYGALLGLFLLGVSKQGSAMDRGNMIAACIAVLLTGTFLVLIKVEVIGLAWTWLIVIGTGTTYFLASLFAFLSKKERLDP